MNCPQSKELEELLARSDADDPSSALWSHLESCQSCQAELDRLSDDVELTQWRRSSSSRKSFEDDAATRDIPACRSMVARLAKMDTSVDAGAQRETNDEETRQTEFLLLFAPSEFDGDLGMLGHYRICQRIGQGGMAFVVEAIDTELDRVVALKILRPGLTESFSKERFLREAKSIAGVHHANVIAIHGISTTLSASPFIAMELMSGGCLQERLRQDEGIVPRQAAEWIAQIADGLSAAHQAGLIHRDIKPSNILLSDKDGSVAKLADFGLARSVNVTNNVTQTGVLLGTPSYMSPEHILKPESVDARSDIYGLGVTLYETLTGEVPFRGTMHQVLQRIVNDDPAAPRNFDSAIPIDLETICLKAMHRDPSRRYPSAIALSLDLRRWLAGEAILARPTSSAEKLLRWIRRSPRVAVLAGTIASLLIIIAAGTLYAAVSIRQAENRLKTESEKVDLAKQQIQSATESVNQQRKLAIGTLSGLVKVVEKTIASLDKPGLQTHQRDVLQQATMALQGLLDSWPNDPLLREEVAVSVLNLAEITDHIGSSDDIIAAWDRATTLVLAMVKEHPEDSNWRDRLYASRFHHANGLVNVDRLAEAIESYQGVRSIVEPLSKTSTDFKYQRDLASCLGSLANCESRRKNNAAARGYYRESLPIFRNLLIENDSHDIRNKLAVTLTNLALVSEFADQSVLYQEARTLLWSCCEPSAQPTHLLARRLAKIDALEGLTAKALGKVDDARRLCTSGIALLVPHVEANPAVNDYRLLLIHLYLQLGESLGLTDEGISTLMLARMNQQILCQANSSVKEFRNDLIGNSIKLVDIYNRMERYQEADSVISEIILLPEPALTCIEAARELVKFNNPMHERNILVLLKEACQNGADRDSLKVDSDFISLFELPEFAERIEH